MIKSMTGFGRGEAFGQGKRLAVELKAVNHRFNEIHLRLPRLLLPLEEKAKRLIQEYISRGRIDGFFSVEDYGERQPTVKVDKKLAESYYKAMEEVQRHLGVSGSPSVMDMVNFPDVITVEQPQEDVELIWPFLEDALRQAVQELVDMRQTEGERLSQDLKQRIDNIGKLNSEIEKRAPSVVEEYRLRLEKRVQDLMGETVVDSDRLTAEVVLFSERSSITEEVVRLNSHLYQVSGCLKSAKPVGRKLDFLVQEMNREINTIGAKASDKEISRVVVEVKSELEKVREQVQNIE